MADSKAHRLIYRGLQDFLLLISIFSALKSRSKDFLNGFRFYWGSVNWMLYITRPRSLKASPLCLSKTTILI